MFGIYHTNPDESLCASIAWTLWTEGHLGTDLLQGAIPGIEDRVYWTVPLYYILLAGWQGLFGPELLAGRCLSLLLGAGTLFLLARRREQAAWTGAVIVLLSPAFQRAMSLARMDILAIFLTVAALVALESSRRPARQVLAGVLAGLAALSHPLGLAAIVGVSTRLLTGRGWGRLWWVAGTLPPLALWGLYILLDPETFLAQMQLQFARKASNPSPLEHLGKYLDFWRPGTLLLATVLGGFAGLILSGRRHLAWLACLTALIPVALLTGEFVYAAYVLPPAAVGLTTLFRRRLAACRGLALVAAIAVGATVLQPPPLAGIHPLYDDYCDMISSNIPANRTVLLGVYPDPWFGLRSREDLRLRFAAPVPLERDRLEDYVLAADDVIIGGYNPPGIRWIASQWKDLATGGQQLWLWDRGELFKYEEIEERLRVRW